MDRDALHPPETAERRSEPERCSGVNMSYCTPAWRRRPLLSSVLCLVLLETLGAAQLLPPAAAPLFDGQPFVAAWNVPTGVCQRLGVALDMAPFQLVTTPAKVVGQPLMLFYSDRLGLYPRVDAITHSLLHGGIPQRGDLRASLAKARADIAHYITATTAPGLAVIDWEDWRPVWERNWGPKSIYRSLSVSHARQRYPFLSPEQTVRVARRHFQAAARSYMCATLSLATKLRPNYQWGYYLYPNCYNYGWEEAGYTGRCPPEVVQQNDDLGWLWQSSTALFPSVYLTASLGGGSHTALFVRHRVQEAMRTAALARPAAALPVYVYTRPVFVDQNRRFLSQADLVSCIGESAAAGASGSVLWGASADYNDTASCEALSAYLSSTLGPYVANVTAAARLCSAVLCQGHGRCLRRRRDTDDHLHLNPASFSILRSEGGYLAVGSLTASDLAKLADKFTCQCYAGRSCSSEISPELPPNPVVIHV
ncbi:hyaluronidase-1-like [Paramormyrops kingsleyae]|uniref:hyaluronidase-1-like n=1 Tax=Paramormyrops kingsleyae TaxID=1676925 RepID=UPI000CD5D830|nr:hyaluronidase-1-like [Paramormyrops kingsleyae]